MKSYKSVHRKTILDYARANKLSYNFNDYVEESVKQDLTVKVDLTNKLIELDKSFDELTFVLHAERELEEVVDITWSGSLFQLSYWTQNKPITHERQISDLSDYKLIKPFDSVITDHNIIEDENTLEPIETDWLLKDLTPDWIMDTITISDSNETIDQHREVLESLLRIEQKNITETKMSHSNDDLKQPFTIDFPLLPVDISTNFSDVVYSEILDSKPTLADNDFSDEMNSMDERAQKLIVSNAGIDSKLNETKKIPHYDDNMISAMKLEYPVFTNPLKTDILEEKEIMNMLVDRGNALQQASISEEELNITSFVNQDYWEEGISKSSLLKLPLPIMELTSWETKIQPKLPEFDFPEWKISYSLVCAMNWTPFHDMIPISSEDIDEFKIHTDLPKAIDQKYTVSREQLYRPIVKLVNDIADNSTAIQVITDSIITTELETTPKQTVPYFTDAPQSEIRSGKVSEIVENKNTESTQTQNLRTPQKSQFDIDLKSSSDEGEDVKQQKSEEIEIFKVNNNKRILERSTSPDSFLSFTSVYENKSPISTPAKIISSKNGLMERQLSSIDREDFDDIDWNDDQDLLEEPSIQKIQPDSFTSNDNISHLLHEIDNRNSDDDWEALNQIVKKKQKTWNSPQESILVPPVQPMLQLLPFFNDKLKTPLEEVMQSSESSLFFRTPTNLSSPTRKLKDSSILWYLNQSESQTSEEMPLADIKWLPPVLSSNSMSCSRVVVNTSNTSLSIIRQFSDNLASGVEIIEADLGNDKTANFYISHKACIVLLSLINLGQHSVDGKLKVLKKLKDINLTTEMVFAIILVKKSQVVSQKELDNLRVFQVSIAILPWLQSFVIPSAADGSDSNLINIVAHLGNIHGVDILTSDLFEGIPERSLHFLRVCGINCIAAALVLKDIALVDLIKASPAYLAIKYGDFISQSQLVSIYNFLTKN